MSQHKDDHWLNASIGYHGQLARRLIKDRSIDWLQIAGIANNAGRKYAHTLEVILASGLEARDKTDHGWCCYSRDENFWRSNRIYGDMSYEALRTIMQKLEENKYIEHMLGYKDWSPNGGTGRVSKYKFTQKMEALLAERAPDLKELPKSDLRLGVFAKYYLTLSKNGEKKQVLTHEDPVLTRQLIEINEAQKRYTWDLAGDTRPPTYWGKGFVIKNQQEKNPNAIQGYVGGRIYTDCQNQPKGQRQQWTVDGEQMVEVDMVSAHTLITYGLAGAVPPGGDMYDVGLPAECRPLVKKLTNVMLNATRSDGIKAVVEDIRFAARDYLAGSPDTDTDYIVSVIGAYRALAGLDLDLIGWINLLLNLDSIYIYDNSPRGPLSVRHGSSIGKPYKIIPTLETLLSQVAGIIKQSHSAIASYFGSGIGYRCQGIEGQLAITTLLACAEAGLPAINIHDGWIVPASRLDEFGGLLQASLRQHNQNQCRIATKGGSTPQIEPARSSAASIASVSAQGSSSSQMAEADVVKDITNDIPTGVAGAPPNDAVHPKPAESPIQASPSAVANNLIPYCTLSEAERADPNLDWTRMDW